MLRANRAWTLSIGLICLAGALQAQCRQALALALDVSGSVDTREYRLQRDGLAWALGTPRVRNALLSNPSAHVELLIFEWSGIEAQYLLVDWTPVRTFTDISQLQETLRQVTRRDTSPGTALGRAMEVARGHLDRRANCWKRTLDVSGDGKSNLGTGPKTARDRFAASGITVNALAVGVDAPNLGDLRQEDIGALSSYFRSEVITGRDAFVQTALGYEDYGRAMARKLERELDSLTLSRVDPAAVQIQTAGSSNQ